MGVGKQKWRGATTRQVGASTAGRAEMTKFYRTYIVNNVKFVFFVITIVETNNK